MGGMKSIVRLILLNLYLFPKCRQATDTVVFVFTLHKIKWMFSSWDYLNSNSGSNDFGATFFGGAF